MLVPPCDAVIVAVPTPTIVTVLPEMVATAELLLLKVIGKFDEAVADNANGASPKTFAGSELNTIVWSAGVTVRVCPTLVAAL